MKIPKLLFIIIAILVVGLLSSYTFISYALPSKDYNPETQTVILSKFGFELGTIQLNTPIDNYVIRGKDRKIAELKITPNSDLDYYSLFNNMEFYDKNNDMEEINRNFKYKYKEFYEEEVDDFKRICKQREEQIEYYNKTTEKQEIRIEVEKYDCYKEKTGSHIEQKIRWIELNKGALIKKEDIIIGIFTNVYAEEYVEWIPTFFGVRINEWATWTEGLNNGLLLYYKLNETSGGTAQDSTPFNRDGTITGTETTDYVWDSGGIIDYSLKFKNAEASTHMWTISNPTADWSISFWGKILATAENYMNFITTGADPTSPEFAFRLGWGADPSPNRTIFITEYDADPITYWSGTAIEDTDWHHYVLVWNDSATTIKVYFDGDSTPVMDTDLGVDIASARLNFHSYTNDDAVLDEIAIWNRTITTSEISNLYNGGSAITYTLSPNTAPTIDTPTIIPSTAYYLSTLNCSTTAYDVDLDTLSINFSWYNGTTLYESALVSGLSNGTLASDTLTSGIQYDGETWNCTVFANDGSDDSALASTTITIQSRPTQNTPILNSTNITLNDTYQNLTCYNQSTADADGDTVKNIYNWYKDGSSIMTLYMPFEENGSSSAYTTAKDYSGNGNDGAVTSATFSSTAGVDGRGAYTFDGLTDYIQLDSTSLVMGWSEITISTWVYINVLRNYDGIVVSRGSSNFYTILGEENAGDGSISFTVGNGGTYVNVVSSNNAISTGRWYNIVATWKSNEAPKLYFNGYLNKTGSTTMSGELANNDFFKIGSDNGLANRWFNGTIDEVRIYNTSLSAEQILALYENNTHIIISNETSEGETWKCEITPNDGSFDGSSLNSSSLIIKTLAPIVSNISIAPAVSYTNTAIEGYFIAKDLNDGTVTAYCDWYNGSTLYSSHSKSVSVDTLYNFSLAPAGIQSKNEEWNFSCNVTDGESWGAINSTTITISNTAPTTPTINDPVNESRQIGNSVTINCNGSTDADGDAVYYVFFGDATTNPPTSILQNTTGTTYDWTTIDGYTYWWFCKAHDTEDTSSATIIKQFVENNISIAYNLTIEPLVAYTNSTLNGSAMVMDSEDTLTVYMNWTNGTTHYSSCTETGVASESRVNCTLPAGVQHEGETWYYTVQTWDGYELGAMNSTTRTISNSLPLIDTPTLEPTNVYTNTTLFNCSTTAYDLDVPETLYVNLTWWNGTTPYSSTVITTTSGTLVSFQLLPSMIQHEGETWNCSVRSYDGTNYSKLNPSITKTILNIAPTTPTQNTPLNNSVTTETSIILNCSGSIDLDNDTLYYEFWGDTSDATSLLQNTTQQWYNWTGLTPDTYYWRCRVNDNQTVSPYTPIWIFANLEGAIKVNETCPAGYTEIMYFDFKDENNITAISGASIDYNLRFNIGGTGYETTNGTLSNISSFKVCIDTTISSIYEVVYGEIEYKKTGYATRRYYLFAGERLATPKVDDTLFFLPNAYATSFLFEFKSTALVPYENYYASLLRWYPELDTYDTVDMGKTDNEGQTIMRVLTEDADYRIGLYKTDGTLVKLLDPIRFACLSSPCSYSIIVEAVALDYTSVYGIASNLEFSRDTFTFTYNDPSQKTSQMELKVYKETGTSSVEICSDTATGYTGIIICNVSAYSGVLKAVAYRTASPSIIIAQKIIQTVSTIFRGTAGLFISFVIFLILVFIGIYSPVLTIFFGVIALVPAVALGSITISIFISIGVLAGLTIHFMKRVG